MSLTLEERLLTNFIYNSIRRINETEECKFCGRECTDKYITDCCLFYCCSSCVQKNLQCNNCKSTTFHVYRFDKFIYSIFEIVKSFKNRDLVDGNSIQNIDNRSRRLILFCIKISTLTASALTHVIKVLDDLPSTDFITLLTKTTDWDTISSYLEFLNYLLTFSKDKTDNFITDLSSSCLFVLHSQDDLTIYNDNQVKASLFDNDGNYYEGDCIRKIPHGKGILHYANGCWHEGCWFNGKRTGDGRYFYSSNVWIEGKWQDDILKELKGLYVNNELYNNKNDLFDAKIGSFIFLEKSTMLLKLDHHHIYFLNAFLSNSLFLPFLFPPCSDLHVLTIQTALTRDDMITLLTICSYITSLTKLTIQDADLTEMIIPANSLQQIKEFNIISCCSLISLHICEKALSSLLLFSLQNLIALEHIDIDLNALSQGFCQYPSSPSHVTINYSDYRKRYMSFTILNLPSLQSLLFDNGCCMEYEALSLSCSSSSYLYYFIVLPNLKDLSFGSDENSNNAYSFYICKDVVLKDLPSLQTLSFGRYSFVKARSLLLQNLPNLISLNFDNSAFSNLKTLSWNGIPAIESISVGSNCMKNIEEFQLINCRRLEKVSIESDSFKSVQSFTLENLTELKTLRIEDKCFSKTVKARFSTIPNLESFYVGKKTFPSLLNAQTENISDVLKTVLTNLWNTNVFLSILLYCLMEENMNTRITSLPITKVREILSSVKGVVFDIDGTLTVPGLINFKRIRERAHIPVGQDIFPYIRSHYSGEEYRQAMKVVEEEELLGQSNLALQPNANELLHFLNDIGIKVAVLTRNSRISMNKTLNLITAQIDVAYCREFQPSKPNVDPFIRISKDLNIPCDHLLLVGDHLDDFVAAIALSSYSCYVRPHYDSSKPETSHIPVMPDKDALSLLNCQQVPPYLAEYKKTHSRYVPHLIIDNVSELYTAWKAIQM